MSDVYPVTGTSAAADQVMTSAEFEALTVTPPEHASENFEVSYEVTSYELDSSGGIMPGVPGATSTETVTVYVEAVTDPVTLEFNAADPATVDKADAIVYTGTDQAELTLKEDTTVDISAILASSFADLDGSEDRSFTITNGSDKDIVVNGTTVAAGGSIDIPAPGLSTDPTALPTIEIGGGPDFSGEINGITVTLNGQDTDADGHWNGSAPEDGTTSGPVSDSVTLDLNVTPVAGDVEIPDAEGDEDSPIAFLAGLTLTDTSPLTQAGGQEFIREVSFDIPPGWDLGPLPALPPGLTFDQSGATITIGVMPGLPNVLETYLDSFTLVAPAHDSSDVTIPVTVTSQDRAWIDGATVQDDQTVVHNVTVTVNPVAETVGTDTDGDGVDDLTMNGDFNYTTPGEEDAWFDLNSDGFDLGADWSNQDSGEQTFARLTPELIHGDGSQADAIGSQFQWFDGSTWHQAVFDGTPVDVPMEYLDTLQFRAAENFSGQFQIGVQAHTVDPDDDGTGSTVEATSGQSYLTNILISPAADEVTMSLTARAQGYEDTDIPLVIRPRSSDPSETFNVTIADIPAGATLTYDGQPVTVTGGVATFVDFDPALPLILTPPPHSNVDFTLDISAQSVDRLDIGGTIHEDVSAPITLPMEIHMKGVADEADVTLTSQSYVEAELDSETDTVMLADMVSVSSPDTDGSERLTLQVTGLPEGFDLSQGTLLTGPDKTGADRVWILQESQIGSTEITVPKNFSGLVEFAVVPVTTENDGDSRTGSPTPIRFVVSPSPEATITTQTEIVEDVRQPLDLGIVHQNGDTDEMISGLRINIDHVESGDFTLYLGAPGSEVPLLIAGLPVVSIGGVEYYELNGTQVGQLSVQGGAHLDGSLGGFDLQYQITDPGDGNVLPVTGDWTDGRFELTATPVSDAPALTIDSIDSVPGDRVTVDTSGEQVTVTLNIANPDHDGSEHLVRVILEDVPEGVSVEGGQLLGGGTWLLTYEGTDALPINAAGGLDLGCHLHRGLWRSRADRRADLGHGADPGSRRSRGIGDRCPVRYGAVVPDHHLPAGHSGTACHDRNLGIHRCRGNRGRQLCAVRHGQCRGHGLDHQPEHPDGHHRRPARGNAGGRHGALGDRRPGGLDCIGDDRIGRRRCHRPGKAGCAYGQHRDHDAAGWQRQQPCRALRTQRHADHRRGRWWPVRDRDHRAPGSGEPGDRQGRDRHRARPVGS
ncbi:hypothetical protein [Ponticoccus litoralis]|uniref:Uncharacterized protein n=1 Tax=Ponticoccus litoralis TaxID=422297 RepID=A0AAW9STK9_9RHOB